MVVDWIGKHVVVLYDDNERVSRKAGIFLRESDNLVYLKEDKGLEIAIPTARIIRIELRGEYT